MLGVVHLIWDVITSISPFNTVLLSFAMVSDHLLQSEERSLVPLVSSQLSVALRHLTCLSRVFYLVMNDDKESYCGLRCSCLLV